jgi:hypothetical protein
LPPTELNPHALKRDWRGARARLYTEKAGAIEDTLDHLSDLEALLEQDDPDAEVCRDIRNLASRLRSIKSDYEHQAA